MSTKTVDEQNHFDKYRQELKTDNLISFEDLEQLVIPLVRNANRIKVAKPSRPSDDAQLISHFGGMPYFEAGEEWPKSRNNNYLNFIFQIYNNGEIYLPDNIQLVQFYYDWEQFPWETQDDGWLVKIYERTDFQQRIKIERPTELEISKYCEVSIESTKSLPDWEGIQIYSDKASKLSCILNENEPWDNYQKVVDKFVKGQDYQSQIGGYPKWVQGESTPLKANGEPMNLLFQIDSEDNAGIMWGDAGLIYVFYDETNKQIEFSLQCH